MLIVPYRYMCDTVHIFMFFIHLFVTTYCKQATRLMSISKLLEINLHTARTQQNIINESWAYMLCYINIKISLTPSVVHYDELQ